MSLQINSVSQSQPLYQLAIAIVNPLI